MSDVQYMVFLSHQPRLSVNLMKLPLPSPQALWESRSAWQWQLKLRELKGPEQNRSRCSLQSGVEALLTRKEILPPFKNCRHQLSLLIHGVASAVIDLNQRQVVTFRTTGTRMLQVADLAECLKLWQECFTSTAQDKTYEADAWSAKTIYHLSTILLQTSLDEIQRAAGNAFASGQSVSVQNARSSYNHLTTTHPVSHDSYLHALEVVTLSLREPDANSETASSPPLWRDYGAFIGVLIIWAYSVKLDQPRKSSLASLDLSPSLPPSVAATSGRDPLKNMYDREQEVPSNDSQDVKSLKGDLHQLVQLVCERLNASNWEICEFKETFLSFWSQLMY